MPTGLLGSERSRARGWFTLNLFWRTFILLALLLVGSSLVWLQALRVIETQPRAVQTAEQIASLVNLSRAALVHADPIARVSLIKTMAEQEGVRLSPREPTDQWLPFDTSPPRVANAAVGAWTSNEPMSARLPEPFAEFGSLTGRIAPRWSVVSVELPVSMAMLPALSSCVKVEPPLSCKGPRFGSPVRLLLTPFVTPQEPSSTKL